MGREKAHIQQGIDNDVKSGVMVRVNSIEINNMILRVTMQWCVTVECDATVRWNE